MRKRTIYQYEDNCEIGCDLRPGGCDLTLKRGKASVTAELNGDQAMGLIEAMMRQIGLRSMRLTKDGYTHFEFSAVHPLQAAIDRQLVEVCEGVKKLDSEVGS